MPDMEYNFTEEEANEASRQEEMERLQAEVSRLTTRCVLLRATVNRLQGQIPETTVGDGIGAPPDFPGLELVEAPAPGTGEVVSDFLVEHPED